MADRCKDHEAVRRQLGREPRPFEVAARCPFGLPSVIENEKSRNMPTTFWLTCPSLDRAIARIESAGGVRRAQKEVGEKTVEEIHARHLERFGSRVAGVREGGYVKCLHAFTALHLSGSIPNAVAQWTLSRLESSYPEDGCCTLRDKKND
ncbi:MAG: DUF501 domain-containing protein [Rubrobacteraceae bacterium]